MTAPISGGVSEAVHRNATLFTPTAFVRCCWDDPVLTKHFLVRDHRSNPVFWWRKTTILEGWRNKPVVSAAERWMLDIGIQMRGFFPFYSRLRRQRCH